MGNGIRIAVGFYTYEIAWVVNNVNGRTLRRNGMMAVLSVLLGLLWGMGYGSPLDSTPLETATGMPPSSKKSPGSSTMLTEELYAAMA
jgi:hypothetical protein